MNTVELLAREIRRVAELRCAYENIDWMPATLVQPAIMLMDAALEEACKAIGSNNTVAILQAYENLREFKK